MLKDLRSLKYPLKTEAIFLIPFELKIMICIKIILNPNNFDFEKSIEFYENPCFKKIGNKYRFFM